MKLRKEDLIEGRAYKVVEVGEGWGKKETSFSLYCESPFVNDGMILQSVGNVYYYDMGCMTDPYWLIEVYPTETIVEILNKYKSSRVSLNGVLLLYDEINIIHVGDKYYIDLYFEGRIVCSYTCGVLQPHNVKFEPELNFATIERV